MKVDLFVQSAASRISDNATPALKAAEDAADLAIPKTFLMEKVWQVCQDVFDRC